MLAKTVLLLVSPLLGTMKSMSFARYSGARPLSALIKVSRQTLYMILYLTGRMWAWIRRGLAATLLVFSLPHK